jgi:hypothetical protein
MLALVVASNGFKMDGSKGYLLFYYSLLVLQTMPKWRQNPGNRTLVPGFWRNFLHQKLSQSKLAHQ